MPSVALTAFPAGDVAPAATGAGNNTGHASRYKLDGPGASGGHGNRGTYREPASAFGTREYAGEGHPGEWKRGLKTGRENIDFGRVIETA